MNKKYKDSSGEEDVYGKNESKNIADRASPERFPCSLKRNDPGEPCVVSRKIKMPKSTEEKLTESESLLNEVGRIAKIGGWELDLISGDYAWTAEVAKIHGMEPDSFAFIESGLEFYLPDSRKHIETAFENAIKNAEPFDLELELITPEGKNKWVRTSGRPKVMDGKVVRITGTMQDISERKNAENKLIENEEILRLFIEHAPASLAMLDKNMHYIAVSRRWVKDLILDDANIIGKSHYDVFPDTTDELKSMHLRALQGEVIIRDELFLKRSNGKNQWLHWEARPWNNARGVQGGIIIFVENITRRKEAEQEIRRSEERYKSLFEQSNDAIFLNTTQGQIIDVNQKACEMFGYTKQDFKKMNVVDLLAPEHKNAGNVGMKDFRKYGHIYVHTLYARSNGEVFDAEVKAGILEGHPNLAHAVVRDISAQKRAEEAIIRSETKYRSLFEKSSDAIIIHYIEGQIIDANTQACEMLGYSKDELKRKNIAELIIQPDKPEILEKLNELKLKGNLRNETQMIRADGKILHVDVNASVLQTEKNIVQAVGRDITKRIQAEEAMMTAKIEAETASRTKSEFLANMSHELRTPLNSIIGFSDILLDGIAGEMETKQEHYIQQISDSGHHLLNLINDILDISKVEAGKMDLIFEIMDPALLINEVVSLTRSLAEKKKLDIILDIENNVPEITADKAKFKQVMYNLLGNAIKFTNPEGTITVGCKTEGKTVVISVRDTGIGISEEDLDKLFKPFGQLDSSISKKYEGTGLGLALVKHIIELHNGKIWVESKPGTGSSFIFELPH